MDLQATQQGSLFLGVKKVGQNTDLCSVAGGLAENPQITLAGKPKLPIDKGMSGPGLVAYVVTSKYAGYLPLLPLGKLLRA
jgi:hypothetical protein